MGDAETVIMVILILMRITRIEESIKIKIYYFDKKKILQDGYCVYYIIYSLLYSLSKNTKYINIILLLFRRSIDYEYEYYLNTAYHLFVSIIASNELRPIDVSHDWVMTRYEQRYYTMVILFLFCIRNRWL